MEFLENIEYYKEFIYICRLDPVTEAPLPKEFPCFAYLKTVYYHYQSKEVAVYLYKNDIQEMLERISNITAQPGRR